MAMSGVRFDFTRIHALLILMANEKLKITKKLRTERKQEYCKYQNCSFSYIV